MREKEWHLSATGWDRQQAQDLISRLEEMLRTGNAESLQLLGEIEAVLHPLGDMSRALALQIEDLEFRDALETIGNIKVALEETDGY